MLSIYRRFVRKKHKKSLLWGLIHKDKRMSNQEIIILILGLLAAMLIIALICVILLNKRNQKVVAQNSELYRNLLKLNSEYTFYADIQSEYVFHENCSSKRKLDKLSLIDVFMSKIELHYDAFNQIIQHIQDNRRSFKNYCKRFDDLKTTIDYGEAHKLRIKLKTFIKIERSICDKAKLTPLLATSITIIASYSSPQGRNHYRKSHTFLFDDIVRGLNESKKLQTQKLTYSYQIRVERAKMSDSLRYDVMKRDGFRCQICGATAKEGAKLHVDHIIPVSKGGKTVMNNLRTLCDRCNLGKSDKIE